MFDKYYFEFEVPLAVLVRTPSSGHSNYFLRSELLETGFLDQNNCFLDT